MRSSIVVGGEMIARTLNSSGAAVWGGGLDAGQVVTLDASGHLFVAGMFEQTATLGDATLTSAGNVDVFLWRLGDR